MAVVHDEQLAEAIQKLCDAEMLTSSAKTSFMLWVQRCVYHTVIYPRTTAMVTNKEKALAEAPADGVEIGSWFECPLHPIETPMHLYDYQAGMCPIAEKAAREVVNLPLHPRTNRKVALKTVDFIRRFQ
jgi:dTDP-4-amino-4,6-dideoxygalactose transaminase